MRGGKRGATGDSGGDEGAAGEHREGAGWGDRRIIRPHGGLTAP